MSTSIELLFLNVFFSPIQCTKNLFWLDSKTTLPTAGGFKFGGNTTPDDSDEDEKEDEDQIGDSERNHTTEQVAYIVFGQ